MLTSIVVPTYNEKSNISSFIKEVFDVLARNNIEGELVIVDDDSPDGTGMLVMEMSKERRGLKAVIRKKEKGLSSAIVEGFKAAKGDILLVMDADLSHPPEAIPRLIDPIKSGRCDMVVGSRYMAGGLIRDWPFKRRLASRIAAMFARTVINVRDPLSGFFAFRRDMISGMQLKVKGFKIGLEIMARGASRRVIEVPYVFQDRKYGKSKLSPAVIMDAVFQVFSLALARNSNLKRLAGL